MIWCTLMAEAGWQVWGVAFDVLLLLLLLPLTLQCCRLLLLSLWHRTRGVMCLMTGRL
jgi:hypothetical protein